MFMRSERLFLRPGWPEDWEELHARVADEAVVKNLAKAPWPYTADDARWFASQPQDQRLPHFFITLPTSAEPARIIGWVGLAQDGHAVELGYWLGREHWGKGYASEAAAAVISVARVLGHKRLVAGHFIDNPASGRVLHKVGFRPTGQIRQRFSLARGTVVASVEHELDLGEPCLCDDDPAMRCAA